MPPCALFLAWAELGPHARATYLRRLADLIDDHVEEIARVECLDMAMLEDSLRLRVIKRGARNFRAYADLAEAYEPRRWASNGTHNAVLRMPAGPAVVITPWNAPFMLSTWKCAPALAAGNTVVLKPAEWSPLSCSLLMDLVAESEFPPGVFNLVQGFGEEVGEALVTDRRVRRVSFTGSPETGRRIGAAAARNLVPFTGELGGKGPFVVYRRRRPRSRRRDGGEDVRRRGPGLSRRNTTARRRVGARRLPRPFYDRHRAPRPRRQSRRRDDDLSAHPPRAPGAGRRLRRTLARSPATRLVFGGERLRADGLWYEPTLIEPRSPTTPRSSRTKSSGRSSPFRPSRRRRSDRARQLHALRTVGHGLHRATRNGPTASARVSAPGRSG